MKSGPGKLFLLNSKARTHRRYAHIKVFLNVLHYEMEYVQYPFNVLCHVTWIILFGHNQRPLAYRLFLSLSFMKLAKYFSQQ